MLKFPKYLFKEDTLKSNITKAEKDPRYIFLRNRFLIAIDLIHDLETDQAADRAILSIVIEEEDKKYYRHKIAARRRGHLGLRALNRDIRQYYKYCENNGLWS